MGDPVRRRSVSLAAGAVCAVGLIDVRCSASLSLPFHNANADEIRKWHTTTACAPGELAADIMENSWSVIIHENAFNCSPAHEVELDNKF